MTYSNLPKYKDGKAIAYSVKEDSIKGYVAEQDTVLNGGTLTNTHKVTSSTASSTASSGGTSSTASGMASSGATGTTTGGSGTTGTGSPKTGDSSALELYGALAAVSAAVLLILLGLRRRRKA